LPRASEDVPVVGQGGCGSLEAKSSKGVEGASWKALADGHGTAVEDPL